MIEKPFSKQRWRIFDVGGLFIHVAQRIAQDVKIMEYFSPWERGFPKPHDCAMGEGVPGLVRWDYFFEDIENVDCVWFPDVGYGDLIDDLRKRGIRTGGCGQGAQEWEGDRFKFREMLKARGLPVMQYKPVEGIEELVEYLKKHPDTWVKLNNDARGVEETFHVETYKKSATKIYKIAAKLDCFAEDQIIMVEKPRPDGGEEVGDEQFFGNDYLDNALLGVELKGCNYAGHFMPYDDLPPVVKHIDDVIRPGLKKGGLQGVRSTEIGAVKVDGKTVGYYSDACQRFGRPSGGALTRGTKNLTEVMYRVAGGEDVKLEYVAPYAAEIVTWSNSANDTAIPIKLKEKDMDRVLLGQFYKNKKDGMFYRIPMGDGGLIAECVGFGKTLEEAQQQATESLALVDFEGKEYEKDGWEQMDEKLDKARKLGVWPK
jgi:hypothetical protein